MRTELQDIASKELFREREKINSLLTSLLPNLTRLDARQPDGYRSYSAARIFFPKYFDITDFQRIFVRS